MSVKDVIKNSVLNNFQSVNITMKTAILFLMAACLLGVYIFIIYRVFTVKSFYSKMFNVSLVLMCVLTAAIIITIQSSIVVSLGMVGALSIVRFRTAIKDPMDLMFLFWSISIGIITGAGMLGLGMMVCVMATILLLFLNYLPERRRSQILMINAAENKAVKDIYEIIKKYDKHFRTQSRNVTKESADILIEVCIKEEEQLLEELLALESIYSVSLIANKGETVY